MPVESKASPVKRKWEKLDFSSMLARMDPIPVLLVSIGVVVGSSLSSLGRKEEKRAESLDSQHFTSLASPLITHPDSLRNTV